MHLADGTDVLVSEMPQELEDDLAWAACMAALSIDNVMLGRTTEVKDVQHLADLIGKAIESRSPEDASADEGAQFLFDPTAVVVMHKAITDSGVAHSLSTVSELIGQTRSIVDRLHNVPGDTSRTDELQELKTFCLALSRRASAFEECPYDTPDDDEV